MAIEPSAGPADQTGDSLLIKELLAHIFIGVEADLMGKKRVFQPFFALQLQKSLLLTVPNLKNASREIHQKLINRYKSIA
jgi:hypothetical protein